MNDIITDIKALQEETLLNLQSSKANNTVRAYKSDFNDFGIFCAQNGFKSLPSDPKIVSLYLTHLSTKDAKMSTLKRRLVSIGVIHKLKGHYLDTKHPSIIENIMGIKRRKGSSQKAKKQGAGRGPILTIGGKPSDWQLVVWKAWIARRRESRARDDRHVRRTGSRFHREFGVGPSCE